MVSLSTLHASPALLAILFSVLLVLSLVAVEEAERRAGSGSGERGGGRGP